MKVTFWVDEQKTKIDPTLLSKTAEKFANELNSEKRGQCNKRSQIRKFYDEVLRLDSMAKERNTEWDFILPQVHMLAAKTAYAKGRRLISDGFLEFMKSSIDQVEQPKDLKVFANFFEATMGFYRMHD